MNSKTITITIDASPEIVYAFASNPANIPIWAPGFARSVSRQNGEWIVETAEGPVTVQFAAPNKFGVLDHVVRLLSGQEILIPMRVIPNGTSSEVMFTLFQTSSMSEQQHVTDSVLVEGDLRKLKAVLEDLNAKV